MSKSSSSSRRVSFSSGSDPVPIRNKKRSVVTVFWGFRLIPKARLSPETFLRRLRAKVARVLRYVSFRKRCCSKNEASASSSSSSNFKRSHSLSDHSNMEDSHRAEAVKDCINFFNNSSSSSSSV